MKYLAYTLFVVAFFEINYGVYIFKMDDMFKFFLLSLISALSGIVLLWGGGSK